MCVAIPMLLSKENQKLYAIPEISNITVCDEVQMEGNKILISLFGQKLQSLVDS